MILAVLAALAAAPAGAQIVEKKRELAKIQSDLRRTRQELDGLRGAESALGHDVDRLQGLDARSRRRVLDLQDAIRRAEARRADLKARLASAGSVGSFWSEALLAETARHVAAEAGRADFSGSDELWAEEFRRLAILEKARHVRGLKGFQRKVAEDEEQARARASELDESRRRAQAEREGRRREYESKRAQLETTQARMVAAARRAAELEDSAKALTALLDELARAARAPRAAKAPALALAKLDLPRHSLPWPAAGRLVSDFGREKDASLGTWTVRQGLLLETKASAPVAAVAPGQVIYVGAFRSYGKVVIVDHGSGFFSVYGSLGDILKSKGDAARSGEPIARAGAAPDGGGRVYLEIRRGTVALDPKAWLQMREGAN